MDTDRLQKHDYVPIFGDGNPCDVVEVSSWLSLLPAFISEIQDVHGGRQERNESRDERERRSPIFDSQGPTDAHSTRKHAVRCVINSSETTRYKLSSGEIPDT